MPYKDAEKRKEAQRKSQRKRRGVDMEGVDIPSLSTRMVTGVVNPKEPLRFNELPIKEGERIEYIQGWLKSRIVSDIEVLLGWFRGLNPEMPNSSRLRRYENAYKYRLFELGYPDEWQN